MMTLAELLVRLDAHLPWAWAEGDGSGLVWADDRDASVERVHCALDLDRDTVAAALEAHADVLIVHHPPIFRAVKRLADVPASAELADCIRARLAVIALHGNLDHSPDSGSHALGERWGVCERRPLSAGPASSALHKIIVYVPEGAFESYRDGLLAQGYGQIGRYDACSFASSGEGTFLPQEGAHPTIGAVGSLERVPERRFEFVVRAHEVSRALADVTRLHPYETVAYDVVPLQNPDPLLGIGCIGTLAEPMSLADFAQRVSLDLAWPTLELYGDGTARISRIAICGGSGGSLAADVRRARPDLYVTGEASYHTCRDLAEIDGVPVLLCGHWASEAILAEHIAALVTRWTPDAALAITAQPRSRAPSQPLQYSHFSP